MYFFYFFFFKSYIAIIGDIIQSKKIKDRSESQKILQTVLNDINKKYSEDIVSKFMITLGDEFQGLLNRGENIMNIITEIEVKIYPVKIRFGVGIGEITTDINPDIPIGADGPAYYNARKMIENLKSTEKKNKAAESNIMIASDVDNEKVDILLNSILSLCTTIREKWTERQREIVFNCLEHGDNQSETAERFGISQSSVQKSLSNAGYYSYKNALDIVTKAFSDIKEN